MRGKASWDEATRRYARNLGARIAGARAARGLSQDALARKLGISQGRIAAVELGKSDLSLRIIAFSVGVYDLTPPSPAPETRDDTRDGGVS